MDEMSFPERVRAIIDRTGGIEALGRKAGVSPRVIRKYRDGEADPSRERVISLARASNVAVLWLATGEGPMALQEVGAIRPVDEPGDDYIALPRYDVQAAAGAGQLVETERVVDWIHFRRDWLRRTLGVNPAQISIVEAVGDSMNPTIDDGDLLLIDVGEPKLRGNGIYVLTVEDVLLVKRVAIKLTGGLVISSDNPRYQATSQELPREDLDRVRIAGRVVWVGSRL